MNSRIKDIVEILDLEPHPEGGYYKETYRSEGVINKSALGESYSGNRNYSTCIYFLLTSDNFSAFHRIIQDEIWHFYKGTTITLHTISPEGKYQKIYIGDELSRGEVPQYVVPGGYWFAAEIEEKNTYALVGCTVSPGFSFEDFEMIPRQDLITLFPQHTELINRLTNKP
jgi:predicted cupin superfamily sugar epimerase